MITVIMAGGKGTRIASVEPDIPKPMIEIGGKPILEHEIVKLKEQGFKDFIITISHMGEIIQNYFGDGSKWGVKIAYFYEETPLGNAGALFRIKDALTDDFLLLNGDSVFDIDFNRFAEYHFEHHALATILTHPNSHPYDSSIVIAKNGIVSKWLSKEDEKPEWYKNRVNAGIHIINKKALNMCDVGEKVDLDRQILKPLCDKGYLCCYDSPEYVKDMGTPDRLKKVREDYESGIIQSRNLCNEQKAIFLDRDGTINKEVGFLTNINRFELLPDAAEAIRKINDMGYLAIVVTNQPVIARGEVTYEELEQIHNKMETLLGEQGAFLDGIYFCPHHPDSGFPGERTELKIKCSCRKPKPGMLLKASEDYHISLADSWMVGNSKNDILAGRNAGCKTALIGKEDYSQTISSNSLLEAVDSIERYEQSN